MNSDSGLFKLCIKKIRFEIRSKDYLYWLEDNVKANVFSLSDLNV